MNRNSFIKNCILGLCSTILPEILRPMEGVVKGGDLSRYYMERYSTENYKKWVDATNKKDLSWVGIDWSVSPKAKEIIDKMIMRIKN